MGDFQIATDHTATEPYSTQPSFVHVPENQPLYRHLGLDPEDDKENLLLGSSLDANIPHMGH